MLSATLQGALPAEASAAGDAVADAVAVSVAAGAGGVVLVPVADVEPDMTATGAGAAAGAGAGAGDGVLAVDVVLADGFAAASPDFDVLASTAGLDAAAAEVSALLAALLAVAGLLAASVDEATLAPGVLGVTDWEPDVAAPPLPPPHPMTNMHEKRAEASEVSGSVWGAWEAFIRRTLVGRGTAAPQPASEIVQRIARAICARCRTKP